VKILISFKFSKYIGSLVIAKYQDGKYKARFENMVSRILRLRLTQLKLKQLSSNYLISYPISFHENMVSRSVNEIYTSHPH